jgi:hypothetical protein
MPQESSLFVVIDHRSSGPIAEPSAPRPQGPLRRLMRRLGRKTSLPGVIAFIIYVTVVGVTVSIAVANRNLRRETLAAEAAAAAQPTDAPATELFPDPTLLEGR